MDLSAKTGSGFRQLSVALAESTSQEHTTSDQLRFGNATLRRMEPVEDPDEQTEFVKGERSILRVSGTDTSLVKPPLIPRDPLGSGPIRLGSEGGNF